MIHNIIRPLAAHSTAIVETIAQFRTDGQPTGEFVCPESEHRAMSICIGAAAASAAGAIKSPV